MHDIEEWTILRCGRYMRREEEEWAMLRREEEGWEMLRREEERWVILPRQRVDLFI